MIAQYSSIQLPLRLWMASPPIDSGDAEDRPQDHRGTGHRSLRILIVEDEFFIALNLEDMLLAQGHVPVGIATSADEAVLLAEQERPDLVLMDVRLIGVRDGIDAAIEIRSRFNIRSIFVSANADPQTKGRAQAAAPIAFLQKPLTEDRLKIALAGLI